LLVPTQYVLKSLTRSGLNSSTIYHTRSTIYVEFPECLPFHIWTVFSR